MGIRIDAVDGAADVHAQGSPGMGGGVVFPQILVAAAARANAGFEQHLVAVWLGHEAWIGHQGHGRAAHQAAADRRETRSRPCKRAWIGQQPGTDLR